MTKHNSADLSDAVEPHFCAGCQKHLNYGTGEFFEVTISAVVDPSGVTLEPTDLDSIRKEMEKTFEALNLQSKVEAEESVMCRRVLSVCIHCFQRWIEDPVRLSNDT